ncbi:MAG: hypothetical protein AVDCRST_MAG56-6814 [uncultured Cytophagales bacterium]|uniref:Uncharacterized protein n=1 Tax=uncultured Cytophagales bacterium TaxID=158755 RepID=A0A6J4L211_9SPHI|nr:MAG: hypothetical protein AVDCRST_MAG56-6814 [uncultured Cytophagales bacterium]
MQKTFFSGTKAKVLLDPNLRRIDRMQAVNSIFNQQIDVQKSGPARIILFNGGSG